MKISIEIVSNDLIQKKIDAVDRAIGNKTKKPEDNMLLRDTVYLLKDIRREIVVEFNRKN